jgi:hypothetical protein
VARPEYRPRPRQGGPSGAITASVDFNLSSGGSFPATDYFFKLFINYNDNGGSYDGYFAFLAWGGSAWNLTLYLASGGFTAALSSSTSVTLSLDTWYTLILSTDGSGNMTATVNGQSAAASDSTYIANTPCALWTDAANEMSFDNLKVTTP